MGYRIFTFGGGASGTTATNASTGGSVTVTAGSSLIHDVAQGRNGRVGLKAVTSSSGTAGSNSAFVRLVDTSTTSNTYTYAFVVTNPASANASNYYTIFTPRGAGGAICRVIARPDYQIQVNDLSSTTIRPTVSAGTMSANSQHFCTLTMTVGTTSSNGSLTFKVYNADGSTLLGSVSSTTANLGTTGAQGADAAINGGNSSSDSIGIAEVQMQDGSTNELTPYAPVNNAPSLSLTAAQTVTPGATFTVNATASDSDGTIASYNWSVVGASSTATPTLSGATTATVTGTAPAAGNLVTLACTVTDNGGASTTATTEIRTRITSGSTGVSLATTPTTVGTWSIVGGSANAAAAVSDSSDSTWLESSNVSATAQSEQLRFQPAGARSAIVLTARLGTDTGTATATVELMEGNISRQVWTQTVTSTPTDYTFTASAGTLSAIVDSDLVGWRVGYTT